MNKNYDTLSIRILNEIKIFLFTSIHQFVCQIWSSTGKLMGFFLLFFSIIHILTLKIGRARHLKDSFHLILIVFKLILIYNESTLNAHKGIADRIDIKKRKYDQYIYNIYYKR